MNKSLLCGWDQDTWRRAAAWAGAPHLAAVNIHDESKWDDLFDVRQKWIEHGGPMDGPKTEFIWQGE